MIIKAVLFDIIGTLVIEKDSSLINKSFVNAFRENNIPVESNFIRSHRGKDKSEIIKNILNHFNYPTELLEPILNSFINNVEERLENFSENKGFKEIIEYLKLNEIKMGVGTGLPKVITEKLFNYLKWEKNLFDYIMTAEEIGKSRPDPIMVIDMMKKFNIKKSEFLKVGDTTADVQEGKNAGVIIAAILSGTQDESQIRKENPDFVIKSLLQIKDIIN